MSSGLGRRLPEGFGMFGFLISFCPDKQKSKRHLNLLSLKLIKELIIKMLV
jgi:hypothetical protein